MSDEDIRRYEQALKRAGRDVVVLERADYEKLVGVTVMTATLAPNTLLRGIGPGGPGVSGTGLGWSSILMSTSDGNLHTLEIWSSNRYRVFEDSSPVGPQVFSLKQHRDGILLSVKPMPPTL